MSRENEPTPRFLKSLHVDLDAKQLTLEATDQSATRLTLAPEGILYEYLPSSPVLPAAGHEPLLAAASPEVAAPLAPEKERPITVSGKLKSAPREGRPDSADHPTAWARFAAHEEAADGQSRAHLYLATFHGETRSIALRLGADTPLEVRGFPRPTREAGKLDGLSVVDILRIGQQPLKREAP
jgi:hypothetical protein